MRRAENGCLEVARALHPSTSETHEANRCIVGKTYGTVSADRQRELSGLEFRANLTNESCYSR
jgi:hypothetical protein